MKGGELIDSLISGIRRDLKDREQRGDSSHIGFINIEPGQDHDEALEQYYVKYPEARDKEGTVIFLMNYRNSTPADGTKREEYANPSADTKPETPLPEPETVSKPEYPPPGAIYDSDDTQEEASTEDLARPQEAKRLSPRDVVAEDFTEQERRKFGIKVTPVLRHQRYGRWAWMG